MPSHRFPSQLSEVPPLQARIVSDAEAAGFDGKPLFAIRLAVEEALVNAARHGNGLDPEREVEARWSIDGDWFRITITDCGCGFDPADVPDPTAEENLARPCGRGVMLMKTYMDEVRFNDEGNVVTLTKHRDSQRPELDDN